MSFIFSNILVNLLMTYAGFSPELTASNDLFGTKVLFKKTVYGLFYLFRKFVRFRRFVLNAPDIYDELNLPDITSYLSRDNRFIFFNFLFLPSQREARRVFSGFFLHLCIFLLALHLLLEFGILEWVTYSEVQYHIASLVVSFKRNPMV